MTNDPLDLGSIAITVRAGRAGVSVLIEQWLEFVDRAHAIDILDLAIDQLTEAKEAIEDAGLVRPTGPRVVELRPKGDPDS